MNRKLIRALSAFTLTVTLVCGAPSALAASSFKAVVTSKTMKVYSQDGSRKLLGTLPKGETVTVKKYSGKAALISYNGKTGIAKVSDLAKASEDTASAAETVAENTDAAATQAVDEGKTVVTSKAVKVYKKASLKSGYVKVKAGTKLTLLSTNGNVAKVKRGSTVGYVKLSSLSETEAQPEAATASATTANASADSVQKYDGKAVVTTQDCKVYAQPSASSAYTSIEKGAQLKLLATKGSCAMVERNGVVGYMDKANLTEAAGTTEQSAVRTADNSTDSSVDLSGNNEEIVYKFLTKVMGYNTAAACGVMANIKYESGYKPTSGGDKGTSYGIVQWHLGRKTRLISWCESNGFDYTTLEGQLYYLDYELKNRYPAVHKRLLAVSNDAQGAYDAGYDFCYNFEAPSNRAGKSVTRGNYARETLWGRYST